MQSLFVLAVLIFGARADEPCTGNQSAIFCYGPLLEVIQNSGFFAGASWFCFWYSSSDSKTFVDMPLLDDPEMVLAAAQSVILNASQ